MGFPKLSSYNSLERRLITKHKIQVLHIKHYVKEGGGGEEGGGDA